MGLLLHYLIAGFSTVADAEVKGHVRSFAFVEIAFDRDQSPAPCRIALPPRAAVPLTVGIPRHPCHSVETSSLSR